MKEKKCCLTKAFRKVFSKAVRQNEPTQNESANALIWPRRKTAVCKKKSRN